MKALCAAIIWLVLLAPATAQVGQIPGWPPTQIVSGGGRSCTDGTNSAAFIARTSGLSNAQQDIYCVLINGLDTDGLFALGDSLLVPGIAPDSTTATLNLLSSSANLGPAVLSGSASFTANTGWAKGGSSSKVDTGFNASTHGVNYTATSASMFCFTLDSWAADSGSCSGYVTNSSLAVYIYPYFTGSFFTDPQSTAGGSNIAYTAGTHFLGFSIASGSSFFHMYENSTATTRSFISMSALVNDDFNTLGDNAAGYRVYNGTIAAWWAGGVLTDGQAANLYSRLCTAITSAHGSC